MISEFINNIKFLPLNFAIKVAFLNCLSLKTFVPTMKKKITINDVDYDENISITLETELLLL